MYSIHRIELPTKFGMKTVNTFLLKGKNEVVLIDSGENSDESMAALERGLGNIQMTVCDIDRIVITHAHVDHMGMAGRVAEAADAMVFVSELVKPWALDHKSMWGQRISVMLPAFLQFYPREMKSTVEEGYGSLISGFQNAWVPINPDRIAIYESEGRIEMAGTDWQVLHLPGHSKTQSAFFNPSNGDFLSADMLLKITPTPVIEPDDQLPGHRNKGILEMMKSYERVRSLDIKTVYPGHYEVLTNAKEVIDRQVKRIEKRTQQCLEFIRSGESSFLGLYNTMYENKFILPALVMLIGYLDLLEERDQIRYEERDGYLQVFPV